jgi:hypothetical protein
MPPGHLCAAARTCAMAATHHNSRPTLYPCCGGGDRPHHRRVDQRQPVKPSGRWPAGVGSVGAGLPRVLTWTLAQCGDRSGRVPTRAELSGRTSSGSRARPYWAKTQSTRQWYQLSIGWIGLLWSPAESDTRRRARNMTSVPWLEDKDRHIGPRTDPGSRPKALVHDSVSSVPATSPGLTARSKAAVAAASTS